MKRSVLVKKRPTKKDNPLTLNVFARVISKRIDSKSYWLIIDLTANLSP